MATIEENLQQIANDVNSIKTNLGLSSNASLQDVVNESEGAVKPTGTVNITENGTVDVTNYASANVNVSGGGEIGDYFTDGYSGGTNALSNIGLWVNRIAKLPALSLSSTATSCKYLFRACKATEIDTSLLDTSNITNMSYMFQNCSNLTHIDVSRFDTRKVTDVSYMFASCSKLVEVDISNFNFNNSVNTIYMFSGCTSLRRLIINNQTMFPTINTTFLGTKPPCYIYVPDNMVDAYKTDENWGVYASYIKGISELPT